MQLSAALEIIGIVAFSLVGVFVGIEYELDVFGICVVALCSSLAGGVIRDLVLGIVPPTSFLHAEYVITVLATVIVSLIIFKIFDKKLTKKSIRIIKSVVNVFDALGLGIFAVSGCQAAVNVGLGDNFILMIFVGTITGVGGGMLRDVLAGRKPIVLRKEIYALAAIIGSILFYFIYDKIDIRLATYLSAGCITLIRVLASWKKLNINYGVKNTDLKSHE